MTTAIRPHGAERMLGAFRALWDEADMIIGHNLLRFDYPLMNAELLRHGLPALTSKLTQDTLRHMVRTKGMKRDQENLGKHFRLEVEKQHMAWQDWQDAYTEDGWAGIRSRAATDVLMHKQMWQEERRQGWLKPQRVWHP